MKKRKACDVDEEDNKVTELVAPYYKNGEISKACDKLIDEATKCWKAELIE